MTELEKRAAVEQVRKLMAEVGVTTSDLLDAEAEEVIPDIGKLDLPDTFGLHDFEIEP